MFSHFDPSIITFLRQLAANNDKNWFAEHKQEYEDKVRTPTLAFIQQMDSWIKMISPHYEATAKKVGGSMMRPYRDVRFSKDKSPYKTNVGIQFKHEIGKDVHAPGFYLHIEPDNVFLGVGTWRPDPESLRKIRDHIVLKPDTFRDAIQHSPFKEIFELEGESLVRAPKGFDPDHPLIEDIKRKDFIAVSRLHNEFLFSPNLCEEVARKFGRAQPFQSFLCAALGLRF
ncbi:DUF2461 domain-containing protein [Aliiglaciecola lipolytica]|uniref:TIGR02453 family protein n=1 Tax=Aliiglaciecola lipolytica E3 TaxID=1127673 RepID=K6XSJ8_9ALTE|nr:DUF2461 domain-containing protein [Aliiglaciecola lipolytica]GAC14661.1 conserved hypothetical protein [Aliiglaciecola lipolytica E3]